MSARRRVQLAYDRILPQSEGAEEDAEESCYIFFSSLKSSMYRNAVCREQPEIL